MYIFTFVSEVIRMVLNSWPGFQDLNLFFISLAKGPWSTLFSLPWSKLHHRPAPSGVKNICQPWNLFKTSQSLSNKGNWNCFKLNRMHMNHNESQLMHPTFKFQDQPCIDVFFWCILVTIRSIHPTHKLSTSSWIFSGEPPVTSPGPLMILASSGISKCRLCAK